MNYLNACNARLTNSSRFIYLHGLHRGRYTAYYIRSPTLLVNVSLYRKETRRSSAIYFNDAFGYGTVLDRQSI